MNAPQHEVIVIGAGPTGMFLAAELDRRGAETVVLEARADATPGTRAIGIHPPTLAALEASGATDRLLSGAVRIPRGEARSAGRRLGEVRFDRLPLRFPFVAAVPQPITEAAVAHGGPPARRGVRVSVVREHGDRVEVVTNAGDALTARIAVVAAGRAGRSLVPTAGVAERAYPDRYLMADIVDPNDESDAVATVTLDASGVLESFPLPHGGRRLVAWMPPSREGDLADASTARLRDAVRARSGSATLAAAVDTVSSFGIRRAVARRMRVGRILLVGDTAHEVSPIGGQGLNLGLLDAATLAPLLAAWARGRPDEDGLRRWERDRLASARTAARIAGANTRFGRARASAAHGLLTGALRLALAAPTAALLTRAYAMDFDRAAPITTARSR